MTEAVTFKVEGIKELSRAFRAVGDGAPAALRAANKRISDHVVDLAMPHVPEKSGRLRHSVRGLATQRSASVKAGSPSQVPYAGAIHWGVGARSGMRGPHNIAGRPFLTDAAKSVEANVEEEYMRDINELIDKHL